MPGGLQLQLAVGDLLAVEPEAQNGMGLSQQLGFPRAESPLEAGATIPTVITRRERSPSRTCTDQMEVVASLTAFELRQWPMA
jgi:hypothetical protein